jgi:hypothetical protein
MKRLRRNIRKPYQHRHAGESRHPDAVPAKAGNQFQEYWIPCRASLARNDKKVITTEFRKPGFRKILDAR